MKDINNTEDIKTLVDSFYLKVSEDELLSHVFNDLAKVNWDLHLPKMYLFWESILFGSGAYKGDMSSAHQRISNLIPLTSKHFMRWISIFEKNLQAQFEGPKTEETLKRAKSILLTLFYKFGADKENFQKELLIQ